MKHLQVAVLCILLLLPGLALAADSSTVTTAGGGASLGAVTNAGTFVVQENGAGLTALQLIDNLSADPCASTTKTVIPFLISTATTTEITPSLAGASTHYYVCSVNIGPVAGAQNIALADDDSDGCGSVTAGMAGGTTAANGWNFAANGGIALGNGGNTVAKTNGTNRVICAVTSAAVVTPGVITVVAAP